MNETQSDTLIVQLTAIGAGPPAAARFKAALKYLGRRCRLQASWMPSTPDAAEVAALADRAANERELTGKGIGGDGE